MIITIRLPVTIETPNAPGTPLYPKLDITVEAQTAKEALDKIGRALSDMTLEELHEPFETKPLDDEWYL